MSIALSPSIRRNVLSLQQTQRVFDRTSLRLSTGKKVNSALDDPSAFFASQNLLSSARSFNRISDNLGQVQSTIKNAQTGLEAIERSLLQAESLAQQILETEDFGFAGGAIPQTLNDLIVADNPNGYWRLNETGGTTATNLGSAGGINGTYQNGATNNGAAIITNQGDTTGVFNGGNDRIIIPNSNQINVGNTAERTIEITFSTNRVNGTRQVLWEEGGGINALNIYIDNDRLYVNGVDQADWGPFNISSGISANTTYHVALVLDSTNGTFEGFLDGASMGTGVVTRSLSSHTGGIAIGNVNGSSFFHDGNANGNLGFDGQIAEVALYNRALTQADFQARTNAIVDDGISLADEVISVIGSANDIAQDSGYRGNNLLIGDTMRAQFNNDNTSGLDVVGQDFSTIGLGLDTVSFENPVDTQLALDNIRAAIETVRQYSRSLSFESNIIDARIEFSRRVANNFEEGSDKLILADMNEESANLLAIQTRQSFGAIALQLVSQTQQSILSLFA